MVRMTRESRAPLIVAIVLLALPVLYVGSYLALVVPEGHFRNDPLREGLYDKWVHYRVMPGQAGRFFWPLEQIDRKLRPEAWVMPWEPAEPRSARTFKRFPLIPPSPASST
jgi:hypothetical protein